MDKHHTDPDGSGHRHALVPMLLCITFALALVLVLAGTDLGRSGPLIATSLVVCLGLMAAMGWSMRR